MGELWEQHEIALVPVLKAGFRGSPEAMQGRLLPHQSPKHSLFWAPRYLPKPKCMTHQRIVMTR